MSSLPPINNILPELSTKSGDVNSRTTLGKRQYQQAFVERDDVKLKLSRRNFKQLKKIVNNNDPHLFDAAGIDKLVIVDEKQASQPQRPIISYVTNQDNLSKYNSNSVFSAPKQLQYFLVNQYEQQIPITAVSQVNSVPATYVTQQLVPINPTVHQPIYVPNCYYQQQYQCNPQVVHANSYMHHNTNLQMQAQLTNLVPMSSIRHAVSIPVNQYEYYKVPSMPTYIQPRQAMTMKVQSIQSRIPAQQNRQFQSFKPVEDCPSISMFQRNEVLAAQTEQLEKLVNSEQEQYKQQNWIQQSVEFKEQQINSGKDQANDNTPTCRADSSRSHNTGNNLTDQLEIETTQLLNDTKVMQGAEKKMLDDLAGKTPKGKRNDNLLSTVGDEGIQDYGQFFNFNGPLPDDMPLLIQYSTLEELEKQQRTRQVLSSAISSNMKFKIITIKNPNSQRHISFMKCPDEDCDKAFRKRQNFIDHIRIHTSEKPFQCTHEGCTTAFAQKANLLKHLQIHQGIKRFQCDECQRKFFTKFNLKSHQLTHLNNRRRNKVVVNSS